MASAFTTCAICMHIQPSGSACEVHQRSQGLSFCQPRFAKRRQHVLLHARVQGVWYWPVVSARNVRVIMCLLSDFLFFSILRLLHLVLLLLLFLRHVLSAGPQAQALRLKLNPCLLLRAACPIFPVPFWFFPLQSSREKSLLKNVVSTKECQG